MSQLITKLKNDHKVLVDAFVEIKGLGIAHPEAPKKLMNAKAAMLAHLKIEDVDLYPILRKAAETDMSIKSTLNVLAQDMDVVSKAALDFFAKYEKGGDAMEFSRDYTKIYMALTTRIRREEENLYPIFDKIVDVKKSA